MNILSIETSCDETSLALVSARGGLEHPQFEIIKHLVASQIETHAPYGGVVPMLAKREHQKNLPLLWQRMMNNELRIKNKKNESETRGIIHNSKFIIPAIDCIAVTVGPGLEPALWQGIEFAQKLGRAHNLPVIGTNHLHGHLFSFLLEEKTEIFNSQFLISKLFPAVQLLASGGHTALVLMRSLTDWELLGQTQDDAAGEAFDKVGRMLKLPFPGGPHIEKLAKEGNPTAIDFPRPMLHSGDYNFSFSGLKTAVLYYIKQQATGNKLQAADKQDVAASFQEAAVDVLAQKTIRAAEEHGAKAVLLSGGVAASQYLRGRIQHDAKEVGAQFISAPITYQTDNAAMIAVAGYLSHLQNKSYPLEANGRLGIA